MTQYTQVLNDGDTIIISRATQDINGAFSVTQNTNSVAVQYNVRATVPSGTVVTGIWITPTELQALPMNGSAWDNIKVKALGSWGTANLKDLNSTHDVLTLAGALYYARTNDTTIRDKVVTNIMSCIGTEVGGRALEPSRNIVSYIISADLINLAQYDSGKNTTFRNFITTLRDSVLDGKSIRTTHTKRPNNWGTHAGAARVAIARYIGDTNDIVTAANIFKGWLGDRTAYSGFEFGDLAWQYDPTKPVAINPLGATKNGNNIDGVLPDDQRRGCGYQWPPCKENYTWEALQGATVQAQLLARAGYNVWAWSDKALFRAVNWLYTVNSYPPTGDDTFIPWIINKVYGVTFKTTTPVGLGKNMSYTDFTHR